MNTVSTYSHVFRSHFFALFCGVLSLYFIFHAVHGERGVLRNYSLASKVETLSHIKTELSAERHALEQKIVMMRPGSVDKDLLEERVRGTLGYRYNNEFSVLSN